jgi:hypothetical protein
MGCVFVWYAVVCCGDECLAVRTSLDSLFYSTLYSILFLFELELELEFGVTLQTREYRGVVVLVDLIRRWEIWRLADGDEHGNWNGNGMDVGESFVVGLH